MRFRSIALLLASTVVTLGAASCIIAPVHANDHDDGGNGAAGRGDANGGAPGRPGTNDQDSGTRGGSNPDGGGSNQPGDPDSGSAMSDAGPLGGGLGDRPECARTGTLVSCDLVLPAPPSGKRLDFNAVDVLYQVGNGWAVRDAYNAQCTGGRGWQYDVPSAPTKVRFCAADCKDIRDALPDAGASASFACVDDP